MSQRADDPAFDDASKVEEQRRFNRAIMQISSCLIVDGLKVDCVVQDLSLVGAKVEVDISRTTPSGETVGLDFLDCTELEIGASVKLPITVVWSNECIAGLRFLCDPYDIAKDLEHLLPEACYKFLLEGQARSSPRVD